MTQPENKSRSIPTTYSMDADQISSVMGFDDPVDFTLDIDLKVVEAIAEGIKRVYKNNRAQIRRIFEDYRNDETARAILSQHLDEEVIQAVFGNEPLI